MVERQPSKLNAAGSSPVSRSILFKRAFGFKPEVFIFGQFYFTKGFSQIKEKALIIKKDWMGRFFIFIWEDWF